MAWRGVASSSFIRKLRREQATTHIAQARTWWERFGFKLLDPESADGLDLYLLTADIEATVRDM